MLFGSGNEIVVSCIVRYLWSWFYGVVDEFVIGGGVFVAVVDGWIVGLIVMWICCDVFCCYWYIVVGFFDINVNDVWLDVES